jgi:hypothetical protein
MAATMKCATMSLHTVVKCDFDYFDNHGKYTGPQDTRLYSLSVLVEPMATLDYYT